MLDDFDQNKNFQTMLSADLLHDQAIQTLAPNMRTKGTIAGGSSTPRTSNIYDADQYTDDQFQPSKNTSMLEHKPWESQMMWNSFLV